MIACASQFITEFNGAALLVLDPETKEWGGTMVMLHGARLALSINEGGMMALSSDPAVCKGGQVSVMPSIEKICAELIRREAAGSGRQTKEIMSAVAGLLRTQPIPVRKKEAHTAAKLGDKVVHSEQGQSSDTWSCMQHETADASDTDCASASDSDASFSTPGHGSQPLDMDPEEALSNIIQGEVEAFVSNLERKFEQAMVGMKVRPDVGAVVAEAETQESAAAQRLVQQVQEAYSAQAGVEHSLLGGTPEAALKLQELEGQIAQNVARAAQAEEERKEHIEHVYAALKAADTAKSSKPAPVSAAKTSEPVGGATAPLAAATVDERIAALQQMAAQSKQMVREQAALADAMTALGAELAAERSGVATPATPSSPRRRDAAVELDVESQHALLYASPKITRESLANGRVEPVAQDHENCGVCAATKMRASSVRQDGGPRPTASAAAHVCAVSQGSAGALGGAVSSE